MASLQDQLLKAGLANSEKAKKIQKSKHKQTKAARKSGKPVVSDTKLAAERTISEQAERDRALNIKKEQRAHEKAVSAQIIQLIENNRIKDQEGEHPFNFVHEKIIKKIHITPKIHNQLSSGYLAIVGYTRNQQMTYEVVPTIVARKIEERDPKNVIHIADAETRKTLDDDPYAEFVIPDDLVW